MTKTEVKESLAGTPGALETSDQVSTSQDSDSAARANVNGTVVDVPKDAKQGVTFGAENGPKLDIELPHADQASEGDQVAPGVVAYEANNGSSNAVQATEDGGVRMLTIIDNPDAPTEYGYKVSIPDGGAVQLAADGGASVKGNAGEVISFVSAPWASDAMGKAVQTWFTTDGSTLTQHVMHNVPGIVYPVTADPWFWNYLGCILGIGVPVGAALVIASYPATWYGLVSASNNPRTQTNIGRYIGWVYTRCSRFIRS